MICIGKITDEDFKVKKVPLNNPEHRLGARGIVFNNDLEIAILNKKNKNEYKLIGGGIEEDEDILLDYYLPSLIYIQFLS